MNKTILIVCYFMLAAICFTGVIIIAIYKPDSTATVIGFVGVMLATVASSTMLFYGLDKTQQKIAKVEENTNGNNNKLQADLAERNAELILLSRENERLRNDRL